MTLKDRILIDLTGIKSSELLNQIFEFIQVLKNNYASSQESNKNKVFEFAGKINDKEARELNDAINSEFNKIEGDW